MLIGLARGTVPKQTSTSKWRTTFVLQRVVLCFRTGTSIFRTVLIATRTILQHETFACSELQLLFV